MLPGLDDGPATWEEAVGMAEIAAADGIEAVVATPHQLGGYAHNTAEMIRRQTFRLQELLDRRRIGIRLFPGADIRIEPDLVAKIRAGKVLTLADAGRHVLLELPHDTYFPLDNLLREMRFSGLVAVLSHPERNRALRGRPQIVRNLGKQGCLFQITAGSLLGKFGPAAQEFSAWMVKKRLAHLVGTDAHGSKSRLPVLGDAFRQIGRWIGEAGAMDLCFHRAAAIIHSGNNLSLPWIVPRRAG